MTTVSSSVLFLFPAISSQEITPDCPKTVALITACYVFKQQASTLMYVGLLKA